MTSPVLELQGAVIARLKAWPALTAIVGTRIYDRVPEAATFPYVALGPSFEMQDDAECIAGSQVGYRVEGWSRATGSPEALKIAEAIKGALHRYDAPLTDNALVFMEWMRTDRLLDPDGLTSHAIVEMSAAIEQP